MGGPGAGRSGSSQSNTSSAAPSRVQSSPGPRPSASAVTPAPARPATAQPAVPAASTTTPVSSGAPPAAAAAGAGGASGQATPIQWSDLQNILSNLNIPNQGATAQPAVDMAQVLSSEAMAPILANPELQQRLLPHLPEGEILPRDREQLRTTLQNPQFQQAVNMFTAAFQSGQLGPLMAQFGLGDKATEAANKGDLEAFSKALEGKPKSDGKGDDKEKKEEKKEGDKDDKKKDEPEEMSLD